MNNKLILRTLNSPFVTPYTDITKGSVLSHADVDNNFIHLKGEVIYSAVTSIGVITLKKLNGDDLVISAVTNDTYVTGATLSTGFTLTLNRNDNVGVSVNLAGLANDVYVISGVYNDITGVVTYTNSTGGTFQVSGFTTGFTQSWTSGSTGNFSIKTINDSGLDATADYAVAEGYLTLSSGEASHAEGYGTIASGDGSHAEGCNTKAIGAWSHAEGGDEGGTTALGISSHSEGQRTTASGGVSHAEGEQTTASGYVSHAEGFITTASGNYSHAEGYGTKAGIRNCLPTSVINGLITVSDNTDYSSVFGYGLVLLDGFKYTYNLINYSAPEFTIQLDDVTVNSGTWVSNTYFLSDMLFPLILGANTHSEGASTLAIGDNSHAEGSETIASGYASHAQGNSTLASGDNSHAEGSNTIASGPNSHAEGEGTIASGSRSHAEGISTTASGDGSHAEGFSTTASGGQSHAGGSNTIASGSRSHAEGYSTTASEFASHAEGYNTVASGDISHAEGFSTTASGFGSHAEGSNTIASGFGSHAEGSNTTASGDYSHAGGSGSTANGHHSFVHGSSSMANGIGTIVLGDNITGNTDNTLYINKLNVKGSTGYNQLRLETSYTPSSSGDTNGNIGNIAWDNTYMYVKTNTGWGRTILDYVF